MNRRLAVTGLALATALGLSACQTAPSDAGKPAPTGGTAAATAGATDPAAAKELTAAAAKLAEDTVRVEMTMGAGLTSAGVMDPKAGTAEMTMTMAGAGDETEIAIRKLGDDMYMRFTGGLANVMGKKWMHLDAADLKAGRTPGPHRRG